MRKIITISIALLLFLSIGQNAFAQHYVSKGETLSSIARQYHMNLNDLIKLNPHIKNPNQIMPNDYIIIRTEYEKQRDLVDYAKSLQYTTAYKYGGQNPPYSTDCSGYVQYIYGKFGIPLPRTSQEQSKKGQPVTFSELQVGDLMFFSTRADKVITHVGIKMDGDYWISNLNEAKDVQILPTWGKWAREYFQWGSRFKM